MKEVKNFLDKIDTSKMEVKYVDFYKMCENEFDIYEWLTQEEGKERLTYCYYHEWICTDTKVGLSVWYLDNKPVCVSFQPYRKSNETFFWLSKEDFDNVKNYVVSLSSERDYTIELLNDDVLTGLIGMAKTIEHKQFEKIQTK